MSIELLRDKIREGMASSSKEEAQRCTHLNTALNNLINKGIVAEDVIEQALGNDLHNTLEAYRNYLKEAGKKDTKSPVTRVRRLAEFYQSVFNIDISNMSFSQVLQAAAVRKYGNRLWTGPVTPKTQKKIQKTHITYRHVARQIIIAADTEEPDAWPLVKIGKGITGATLGSASKVLRDYFTGESVPTERLTDVRMNYIEKFLMLPKNSCLDKIIRRVDHNDRGKKKSEKSIAHSKRRKIKHTTLNKKLQRVFEEYSAFKIDGEQPEIINVTEEIRASKYFTLTTEVHEDNKRDSAWTINTKGKCGSRNGFYSNLVSFQDYCIVDLKMDFSEPGTYHLTEPTLLKNMIKDFSKKKYGGSWVTRLLNWIIRGLQPQGYLFFCADLEHRPMSEFQEDIDWIKMKYRSWMKDSKKSVLTVGKAYKGKKYIQFLLNMPYQERRKLIHEASTWMRNRAINIQLEAHQQIEWAESASGPVVEAKHYKRAAKLITDAFSMIKAAVVQEVCLYTAPRADNWTKLKYYSNATKQDSTFSSLTFYRQRNTYRLFIPLYGTALVNAVPGELIRNIKNGSSEKAVDIDMQLPERLTPLIKTLLSIREDYIKMDLVRFGGAVESELELLMPKRSTIAKYEEGSIEAGLESIFCHDEGKFGEVFQTCTYNAYLSVAPEEKQHGINIHATRHLSAEQHLDEHPGDYPGAAAKLNDEIEQIIKTYGNHDRGTAQRKISAMAQNDGGYVFEG